MHRYEERKVVDFHTHAFPEKVAARAMATLTEAYGVTAVGEPTVGGLTAFMDEVGVRISVVLPVATRSDQVRSINDWAAAAGTERVVCFGTLHPDLPDLAEEVKRIVGLGLKGIKLQPNFQSFAPDDPRMWPAYEAAEGRLVVVFHSGQEITPVDHVWAQPQAMARVNDAFPGLAILVSHMGGYRMWEEVHRHLVGRELYFETSYCRPEDLPDEAMLGLIRRHGVSKVLFGSDFPWGHAGQDLVRLARLGLADEELEAICWGTAQRLLGRA